MFGDIFIVLIVVSGFVLFVWSMLDPDFVADDPYDTEPWKDEK
jgi:hypothetical protein